MDDTQTYQEQRSTGKMKNNGAKQQHHCGTPNHINFTAHGILRMKQTISLLNEHPGAPTSTNASDHGL
ncbi:hypothetical protein M9458_057583, partial [Cirrhinus mrigala]